jgi:hypothetical protein
LFSTALLIRALLECVLELQDATAVPATLKPNWGKKRLNCIMHDVMPGLVPGIHDLLFLEEDVDGRIKSGHDTVS